VLVGEMRESIGALQGFVVYSSQQAWILSVIESSSS
jgi:hypothetical protein